MIQDHLGNVRVRFADLNGDGKINITDPGKGSGQEKELLGSYHFYPYGMPMNGLFHQQGLVENAYQYNGIDYLDLGDLNVNHAMWRTLDPAIGRWWQGDPLAEVDRSFSPYNSMWASPVNFADPDGDFAFAWGWAAVGGAVAGLTAGFASDWDFKAVALSTIGGFTAGGLIPNLVGSGSGGVEPIMVSSHGRSSVGINIGHFGLIGVQSTATLLANTQSLSAITFVQERPSWKDVFSNYPTYDTDAWELVGGNALYNHNEWPSAFNNDCALRVCYALNQSGYQIPHEKGKTISGSGGDWHYFRTTDLEKFLTNAWGKADIKSSNIKDFKGQRGIIYFNTQGLWNDAFGHFTLWDGKIRVGGNYPTEFYFKNANYVKLWKLD